MTKKNENFQKIELTETEMTKINGGGGESADPFVDSVSCLDFGIAEVCVARGTNGFILVHGHFMGYRW